MDKHKSVRQYCWTARSTCSHFIRAHPKERLGSDVSDRVVRLPHSECCYPARSFHRTASLIYSIFLSLLSLRFYIFQSKWMLQKGGTSSLLVLSKSTEMWRQFEGWQLWNCVCHSLSILSPFFLFNASSANSVQFCIRQPKILAPFSKGWRHCVSVCQSLT